MAIYISDKAQKGGDIARAGIYNDGARCTRIPDQSIASPNHYGDVRFDVNPTHASRLGSMHSGWSPGVVRLEQPSYYPASPTLTHVEQCGRLEHVIILGASVCVCVCHSTHIKQSNEGCCIDAAQSSYIYVYVYQSKRLLHPRR